MRASLILLAGLAACNIFPPGPGSGSGGVDLPEASVVARHPWLAGLRLPAHLRRPPLQTEAEIASSIEELLTGDFSVYPAAGQRLVQRGEIVVPYLGHAAEHYPAAAEHPVRIRIVLRLVLEKVPPSHVGTSLGSPYAEVRAAGAASAGERHLTQHAPRLVQLLEDDVVEVRRAAVTSLRMLSNAFYGYRPEQRPSRRRKAVARWRALWGAG